MKKTVEQKNAQMGTLWGEGSLNRKKTNRLSDRKQNIIHSISLISKGMQSNTEIEFFTYQIDEDEGA